MARPRKTISPEQVKEVETLAAVLNQEQIASYFGISHDTFSRICERDENVLRSYKKGKAKAIGSIGGNLIQQAKAGNVSAAIFYLKTQAGWKETQSLEHFSPDGSMSPGKTADLTDEELADELKKHGIKQEDI